VLVALDPDATCEIRGADDIACSGQVKVEVDAISETRGAEGSDKHGAHEPRDASQIEIDIDGTDGMEGTCTDDPKVAGMDVPGLPARPSLESLVMWDSSCSPKHENGLGKKPCTLRSSIKFCLGVMKKQWFLCMMMTAIVLAFPLKEIGRDSSVIMPKYTVKLPSVVLIFLSQGLCLEPRAVARACKQFHIIGFTTFFTFIVYPLVVMGFTSLLSKIGYNEYLLTGIVVLSVMPTTTAMSTILVTISGGNVVVAVANATLGNISGVFCTPVLVMLLMSSTVQISFRAVALKLGYSILLPFCIGQTIRNIPKVKRFTQKHKPRFSIFNHLVLVAIIFCSFCNIFAMKLSEYGVAWYDILGQILVNICLHLVVVVLAWFSSGWACLPDRVAVFFVAVQKTIVMGLPMVHALFGDDPLRDLYALPLVMYHPVELILGSLFGHKVQQMMLKKGFLCKDQVLAARGRMRRGNFLGAAAVMRPPSVTESPRASRRSQMDLTMA